MDDQEWRPWIARDRCDAVCEEHLKYLIGGEAFDDEGNLIDPEVSPDALAEAKYTRYYRLMEDFAEAASNGAYGDSDENSLDKAIRSTELGIRVVSDLHGARRYRELDLMLWGHYEGIERLLDRWPHVRPTPLDYGNIACVVESYLRIPVKTQSMDRILVDLLVAQEYCDTAISVIPNNKWMQYISVYSVNALISAAMTGVLSPFLVGLGSFSPLGAITLFLVNFSVVSRVRFLLFDDRRKLIEALDEIRGCYIALGRHGPTTATHLINRLEYAANKGAVWPPALFVLLEDIKARGNRF